MNKLLNNLLGMYKQAKMKKSAMIIDEILDRKDGASYNPQDFYDYVSQQLDVLNSKDIARALDSGTEEDVKKALCEYIKLGEYNPAICDYINSVNWLEEEDVEKWFSIKLSDEQAKEFAKLLTENNIKNKSKKEGEEIRVSFFLLPSSIGVAQGLLAATLSKFPDKQASTIKRAEEDLIEVGWGLENSDEDMIKSIAEDAGRKINKNFWERINKDIDKVESWFLKEGYKKFFTKVRDEGHGKDNELGGTAWMTKQQLEDYISQAEKYDENSYMLLENTGSLYIDINHDDALEFHLFIYVDDKDLNELGIESKRVSKNKKQSSKNTKLTKKAGNEMFSQAVLSDKQFKELANSAKDMGDEIWGILDGKIVHIIAIISNENKVLYIEPYYGEEETKETYENADEAFDADFFTLELLPGDDTYADIGFVAKESSKNKKLTKKAMKKSAGYSNNSDYFGDWFGKGQIDFSKIINPNDEGKVWMVKLWGGSGYILDVYLVKANDFYDATNKVFEWSYENEGINKNVFDREHLEKEALEYFKDEPDMFGKKLEEEDFIDRFLEEYYVGNEDYSLFARAENFFAEEVPEEYLKGNKQSSKTKAVRKQAKYEETVQGDEKVKDSAKSFGYDIKFAGHYGRWIYYYLIDEKGNIIRDDKEYQKVYDEMKKRIDDDIDIDNYAFAKGLIEEVDGELMRVPTIVISEYTLRSNHKDREENTGLEEFKRDFNLSSSTRKKAVLQESENGLGYVLPNGSVVDPIKDKGILETELRDNTKLLKEQKEKLAKLEKHMKDNPNINFGKFPGDVFEQANVLKNNIKYIEEFNKTIEEILNVSKQATKKQVEKVLTLKEAIGKDESEFKNMEDIVDYINHLPLNANKSSWVVEGFGGNIIDVENLSNGEKATINLKKNFNSRYATRQNKLFKSATIKHENGVYNVYSESGKCLGKGYKTKEEAEKRLKQVEYFKHKNASTLKVAKANLNGIIKVMDKMWHGNEDKNYITIGKWGIGLGGYDTGYVISYDGNELFAITPDNVYDAWKNDDFVKELTGYTQNEIFQFIKDNYKHADLPYLEFDGSNIDIETEKKSNKRTSLKQVVISKMAKIKK